MHRIVPVGALVAAVLAFGAPATAGGGGCQEADTTDTTTTVLLRANCFGPTINHVAAGATVTFRNVDAWNHTVTGAGLKWGSISAIGPDGRMEATFADPGIYPYVCLLHPGMLGAVVVDGDPAVAAPPATGPTPVVPARPEAAVLAGAAVPGSAIPGSGVSWAFALGLAALAAVLGAAATAWMPRRNPPPLR